MKLGINITALLFLFTACGQNNCPPDINKKPMFGMANKCPEQLEADKIFLKEMDDIFDGDRTSAAQDRVNRAWGYFYQGHSDSAMMRFNQAWLLDSSNAEIFWGYGNLLGQQKKFSESLEFFEKALSINPNNSNIWLSASSSYGQLFYQSKDKKYLDKTIECLKKSVSLDPNNGSAYGQLTAAYTYIVQKDSARKYLQITDQLDPSAINPEVREMLKEK